MITDCDGRSDGQTVGQTESIMANTALCIASYADALSMKRSVMHSLAYSGSERSTPATVRVRHGIARPLSHIYGAIARNYPYP